GREATAQLRHALLEALETAAQLVLEVLGRELVQPLHLALEGRDVALHQLRGLLERVALRERLADANDLLHGVDVVVVIAGRGRLHEALLRPVDELAWGDVADARRLGRRQAKAR